MPLLNRELDTLADNASELRRFIEYLRSEDYTADKLKGLARVLGSIDELFSNTGKISFFYGEAFSRKPTPLTVLLSLFWLSCEVDARAFEAHVPAAQRAFLSSSGLVASVGDGARIKGRVSIVEFESCYLLSDNLFYNHGGGKFTEDPVQEDSTRSYPTMPIHASSIELYRRREAETAESLLDIGCGSGVQSICGGSSSLRRTGIDNSPRSVAFARLNAQLNGIAADYHVADCMQFESRDRFDHILFNSPSFFEIEAVGMSPEKLPGAQYRSELGPRFIDQRLEHLLSSTGGLCQVWSVLYLPRAAPTVRSALEDSIPQLHQRFEITISEIKDSPMAISTKAISSGKISGSSPLAFPSLEKLKERIRCHDIVEVAVAIINARIK